MLASMEEALSFGGLGAVVAELVRLPMTASRRLQLAAEKTGTMGLVVRRWRRQTEASDFRPTVRGNDQGACERRAVRGASGSGCGKAEMVSGTDAGESG